MFECVIITTDNVETVCSIIELAKLHRNRGYYKKAESLFIEAEQIARRMFGNDGKWTRVSVEHLSQPYEAWNKPEKAEEWRSKLPQTEAVEE